MALDISKIVQFDTVHIIFRIGYSAQFVRSKKRLRMEMARHRNIRGNSMTSVIGTVTSNNYASRSMTLYVTNTDLANSELRGKAKHPRLHGATAQLTLGYEYIGHMEVIRPNPDASDEELFVNPGQQGLGAARFNARLFRIPVTF